MKIGYARVSTLDQNPDMQRDELEKAGCEEVIVDRVSGAVASRPGLEKVRGLLRKGNTLASISTAMGRPNSLSAIAAQPGAGFTPSVSKSWY